MFDGMENRIASAVFAVPAVKGIEFGNGFACAALRGSQNNDPFFVDEDGTVRTKSNNHGGILGGISDGSEIILRAHIKPTPSIFREQETVNRSQEEINIQIKGRHDPVIVPRAVVVIEAMTALTLLDAILVNMTARVDKILDFYNK